MIAQVDIEIGGQRIDRQYGDWMHIWNQLTLEPGKETAYYKMVGQTTQLVYIIDPSFSAIDGPCDADGIEQICAPRNALPETTLYVPFQFWYCRNPGLALPLIALQYHDVKINLDIRPLDECLWAVRDLNCDCSGALISQIGAACGSDVRVTAAYNQSIVAGSLYIDYIFLDTDERRHMARNPHEYLIEQLQFTGDESVGSSSNKIVLDLIHPVKELIWVVQADKNVDYCGSFACGQLLYRLLGAQPFNYTDGTDALPNAIHAFGGPRAIAGIDTGNAVIDQDGLFTDAGAIDIQAIGASFWNNPVGQPYGQPNLGWASGGVGGSQHPARNMWNSGVSDSGTFVLSENALNMHCWGQNPVVTAQLKLNGQDRFSEREGTYFDLVQPYQHHTRTPDTGINVYSFGINPEEHQPSGTCNFSRIDNADLLMVLSNAIIGGTQTAKVRVYATNYNVLRVMSGMGGLAYSS